MRGLALTVQLVGIIRIARDLRRRHKEGDGPSMNEKVRLALASLHADRRSRLDRSEALIKAQSTVAGGGGAVLSENMPLEQRIKHLEARQSHADKLLHQYEQSLREESKTLRTEQDSLQRSIAGLQDDAKEAALKKLDDDLVGWILLALGTALSGLALVL